LLSEEVKEALASFFVSNSLRKARSSSKALPTNLRGFDFLPQSQQQRAFFSPQRKEVRRVTVERCFK
jgi:hypothetical protein